MREGDAQFSVIAPALPLCSILLLGSLAFSVQSPAYWTATAGIYGLLLVFCHQTTKADCAEMSALLRLFIPFVLAAFLGALAITLGKR